MVDPETQMLLEQLKDIRLPTEPGWFPLAVGWWVLIGCLAFIIIALVIRFAIRRYRWRYARLAILELETIEAGEDANWLIQTHQILRRASLCYFPRHDVANMPDERWVALLAHPGKYTSKPAIWNETNLALINGGLYRNPESLSGNDKAMLIQQAKAWLDVLPERCKSISKAIATHGLKGVAHDV